MPVIVEIKMLKWMRAVTVVHCSFVMSDSLLLNDSGSPVRHRMPRIKRPTLMHGSLLAQWTEFLLELVFRLLLTPLARGEAKMWMTSQTALCWMTKVQSTVCVWWQRGALALMLAQLWRMTMCKPWKIR